MSHDTRVDVTCPCGAVFKAPLRKIRVGKGKYCSPECGYKFRPPPSHRNGVPVPPKQRRTCQTCGVVFELALSRVIHNGAGSYCSRDCQVESLRGVRPAPGATTKHGLYRSAEYRVWKGMRGRCSNPNSSRWADYGGRGITICPEWDDFAVFLRDMGPRPTPRHSIDRIDNDGNYEPGNCRWADDVTQSRNRRPSHLWKKRTPKPPAPCGTSAGYHRHRRNGESPCAACRDVVNERRRRVRKENQ